MGTPPLRKARAQLASGGNSQRRVGSWKGPPAAHKMTGDRQVSPSTHLRVLRASYTGQTLETWRGALHFSDDTDLRDASWAWRWDPSPVTSLRYSDTKRKCPSGLRPPLATALSLEPNNTVLIVPSRYSIPSDSKKR